MVKIGDKIRIINEDYDDWNEKYKGAVFEVSDICHGKSRRKCSDPNCKHRGYDESMKGQALICADGLNISVYEYEFEIIDESDNCHLINKKTKLKRGTYFLMKEK